MSTPDRVHSGTMLEHTRKIMDYLTIEEIVEAYERLYGPLPDPRQCPWCEVWFVLSEGGRRAGPHVIYHSRACAMNAARSAHEQRKRDAR